MAARRGKSQARRNSGSNGLPSWAWLVIGVLVTLLAVLLVPRFLKSDGGADGFFRPKPNPDAQPAATSEDGEAIAPDTAPAGDAGKAADDKDKQTQYAFYDLLPGQEVAMSDAELAASAKAEAEAQAKAAKQTATEAAAAAAAASVGQDGSLPIPVSETAATPAATAASNAAKPAETASTQTAAASTPKPEAGDARYILQAGAFGASGDAETVKAKIAMLGLNARVESAQINGKTVYRVRMGPYGSASELAEAKAKLSGGGLPAMAVKTN